MADDRDLEKRLADLRYMKQMRQRMGRHAWRRALIFLAIVIVGALAFEYGGDKVLGGFYTKQKAAIQKQVRGILRFGQKVQQRESVSDVPEKQSGRRPQPREP